METTRKCPFCAEPIATEAVRCPHCRSRLVTLDPEVWHRDQPERRFAGVAAAVSRAFAIPVGIVRVGLIVLVFFHLAGAILYGVLWAIIPYRADEESLAERLFDHAKTLAGQLRPRRPPTSGRIVPGEPQA
jgi:phage shock protein PspC (stress-responsive transcriptional regulator)